MKKNLFLNAVMMTLLIVASCSKPPTTQTPPASPAADDKRNVQLKDVIIDHLPSPYFHFIYNDSGYVTALDFASGLFIYNFDYDNKRVKHLFDERLKRHLSYQYSNGRVTAIKNTDQFGKARWVYDFTYYNNTQLSQIRWFSFDDDGKDSVLQRTVLLLYSNDGNLSISNDYRRNINGQFLWSKTMTFTDYDQGTNVDDFYVLKDFFDDVLFLPQVRFQKNNPKHISSKSVANDYEVDYTYEYNAARLPVKKTAHLTWTRGSQAGDQFTGDERFTYY